MFKPLEDIFNRYFISTINQREIFYVAPFIQKFVYAVKYTFINSLLTYFAISLIDLIYFTSLLAWTMINFY